MTHPLSQDLEFILEQMPASAWQELKGQRLFITGGTGFFGCWLLESLAAANRRFDLGISTVVLTRYSDAFVRKAPHLAGDSAIELLPGDVRTFDFPAGDFGYVIHAATEASMKQIVEAPLEMFSTIVDGTKRVLEFARAKSIKKFLLTSSGAVYGKQPSGLNHVFEDYCGSPDPMNPLSVYGVGKRTAEQLCSVYASSFGFECKIARCFAFVGPHLPLDAHFAIGNFIRDAMSRRNIQINGDGTPRRSYLYAADLAIWLLTILLRGANCRPYNVGSEHDLSISEIAGKVIDILAPELEIQVARQPGEGLIADRYVPSTKRAREELGLKESFDLLASIQRTAEWHNFILEEKMTCA